MSPILTLPAPCCIDRIRPNQPLRPPLAPARLSLLADEVAMQGAIEAAGTTTTVVSAFLSKVMRSKRACGGLPHHKPPRACRLSSAASPGPHAHATLRWEPLRVTTYLPICCAVLCCAGAQHPRRAPPRAQRGRPVPLCPRGPGGRGAPCCWPAAPQQPACLWARGSVRALPHCCGRNGPSTSLRRS